MIRYLRAFWVALMLTIRGQTPTRRYQRLWDWIDSAVPLTQAIDEACEKSGLDKAQRQQTRLTLDGRETSMQTVLNTFKHHFTEEYPYLLNNLTEHSITAIYASNMNDQYFISRLHDSEPIVQNDTVLQAISRLGEHLGNIPPSTELET